MVFIMGAVKDNKVNEALNELAIEVERIKKHRFTRRVQRTTSQHA